MKFADKLSHLTENENKARISRAADLPGNAINDYINKGHRPGVDNALALARALKVPLEWLVDDKAEWPPPETTSLRLDSVKESILMHEVCVRHRRILLELLAVLTLAESRDWSKAGSLKSSDDPLPEGLADLMGTIALLESALDRLRWLDPWFVSRVTHHDLEGHDRPEKDFDRVGVELRLGALRNRSDFAHAVRLFAKDRVRHWNLGEPGIVAVSPDGTVPFASVPGANPYPMLHAMDFPPETKKSNDQKPPQKRK